MKEENNKNNTYRNLSKYDLGILSGSQRFIHLPTSFASKALYYAPFVGHFICTSDYHVNRNSFFYYLLVYVEYGEFEFTFQNNTFVAKEGDIVLIDTTRPHTYSALTGLSFLFFHFDGSSSKYFYENITESDNFLIRLPNNSRVVNAMKNILNMAYYGQENEIRISAQIHYVLSEISTINFEVLKPKENTITKSIEYLNQHFTENFPIEKLAEYVNFSPYYFSRLFKKQTGMSPHMYRIKLRIALASELLVSNNESIENISELCGFNSSQHFIRSFKKHYKCTPTEFRKKMLN